MNPWFDLAEVEKLLDYIYHNGDCVLRPCDPPRYNHMTADVAGIQTNMTVAPHHICIHGRKWAITIPIQDTPRWGVMTIAERMRSQRANDNGIDDWPPIEVFGNAKYYVSTPPQFEGDQHEFEKDLILLRMFEHIWNP